MATPTADPALGYLARSAIFGELDDTARLAVRQRMRPGKYGGGQLIFSRGDVGDDIFLVMAGKVKLSIMTSEGRELSLIHAGPGDVFGEIAALDGGERTADATAITDCQVLVLPKKALSSLMLDQPEIAEGLIRFLCKRLRDTDNKLEAIALHAIEVRLARFFLTLLADKPLTRGKATIALGMSQSDLGLLIGASRPKVNGALSLLEADGAITKQGSDWLCDVARLRQAADADE